MIVKTPPTKTPIAKRHPTHYLMHKYWARKPHNVINEFIKFFTKEGDVVLDPFAGSGVTVIESLKINRKVIGIDINPISSHIIRGTCEKIPERDYDKVVKEIARKVKSITEQFYGIPCDKCGKVAIVNYTVWSSLIDCSSCNFEFPVILSKKMAKTYDCTKCNAPNKLRYSVKRRDAPYSVSYECHSCGHKNKKILEEKEVVRLLKQENLSRNDTKYAEMIPNPRTLSEKGMKISDLFTSRNLIILESIFHEINKISNIKLKNTLMFVFTSSLAQSSRLIAYRSGLTTGGPAWTVSGFWIPPVNLEINPLNNFITKAKKIKLGKKELSKDPQSLGMDNFHEAKNSEDLNDDANVLILNTSINSISKEEIPSETVDYIFTDPPYGDSVPYLEYSIIWSNWLHKKLDLENEIIISDSPIRNKDVEDYRTLLVKAFQNCYRMLKKNHWMTITFHNKSFETWYVLLDSVREAGFKYVSAKYLVPAVIPVKAQLSKEGSTSGDIVLHYCKSTSKVKSQKSYDSSHIEEEIIQRVTDLLLFMGGKAPSNQVLNSVLFLLLEYDHIHISLVELKPLLTENFEYGDGYWMLKNKPASIKNSFITLVTSILNDKSIQSLDEHEIIAKIYDSLEAWQTPSITQVRDEIKLILKKKKDSVFAKLDNFL